MHAGADEAFLVVGAAFVLLGALELGYFVPCLLSWIVGLQYKHVYNPLPTTVHGSPYRLDSFSGRTCAEAKPPLKSSSFADWRGKRGSGTEVGRPVAGAAAPPHP